MIHFSPFTHVIIMNSSIRMWVFYLAKRISTLISWHSSIYIILISFSSIRVLKGSDITSYIDGLNSKWIDMVFLVFIECCQGPDYSSWLISSLGLILFVMFFLMNDCRLILSHRNLYVEAFRYAFLKYVYLLLELLYFHSI